MEGKKTCTLLVAILILSTAMVNMGTATQLPKLFVDPPTYTATLLGEVFTVDINIANVQDLLLFEFKLGYNTTLLDAVDVVIGPFPQPLSWGGTEIHEPEGYVWVSGICMQAAEGSGTLATITFNATYAESASCTLDLYDTELYDSEATPITHDVDDGNYKFGFLGITTATGKPLYCFGENVEIHGNLTLDGSPCQGLVALEVTDASNHSLVVRTLQTGSTPSPGNITIVQVYPCDSWGDPKESFETGTSAYFNVTVRNNGTVPKNVTIFLNAYDQDTVPLAVGPIQISPLGSGTTFSAVRPLWIPEWASLGDGTVYASAFTDWLGPGPSGDRPRNGTPYCPEKSATFQIIDCPQGTAALEAQVLNNDIPAGNYNLTFKLPVYGLWAGNYTVYASSSHRGQQAINSTTFQTKLLGDVNGDGRVRANDIIIVGNALFTYPGDPDYNPDADVNQDGRIGAADIIIIGIHLFEGI